VKVLFDNSSSPHPKTHIEKCLKTFGRSYTLTVRGIISATEERIDKGIFLNNAAKLMSNFKMTRRGPFKGVKVLNGKGVDNDRGILGESWNVIEDSVLDLKKFLIGQPNASRQRVLVEISEDERKRVAGKLWHMFKQLLPLLMSETSLGLVGASKLLFSVFPEVALPVDNNQWRKLFQTVDYSDIICLMAREIIEWERLSRQKIDSCDRSISTLPSIYNVMAMGAREGKTHKRSLKS
jgi:hypothetical protein